MPTSPAQVAANRRNSARSTGPKTVDGKRQSRANALKHGLRAAVVTPVADEASLYERTVGVYETMKPQTGYQAWACAGIARITLQLDRLWALEKQIRAGAAWRAIEFWEEDQRLEAERIGARLARNPARLVGELSRSAAGSAWLIERWELLADCAGRQSWSIEETALAHDLLGTPRELRGSDPGPTHAETDQPRPSDPAEVALARDQITDLEAHRARVVEADAVARALAEADADDFHNRDLIQFRRYERALQTDLNRYYTMSQHESPHATINPKLLATIPTGFLPPVPIQDEPDPIPPAPNETNPPAPNEANPTVIATPNEANPPAPNEANSPEIVAPNEAILPTLDEAKPPEIVAPNEANPPAPNEANPPAPNEANPPEIVAPNEAKPPAPNEAILPTPVHRDQARPRAFGPPDDAAAGLSPELRALLEADLPDPDTLDPAWCREYILANLDISGSGRFGVRGNDPILPVSAAKPG